jgi:RNA polymerase sigma factor (sigma-70 family)
MDSSLPAQSLPRSQPRPLALAAASDERLASLVAAGSERAFAAIYRRYHQRLYRYCLAVLRNDADAQDVLQAAFTAAYGALAEQRRAAPLRPWLFRIVHNEAVSLLRRRRDEHELSEADGIAGPTVEEQAGRRADLRALIADLARLPDRQRAALVMRELEGLSHEEIGLVLQSSAPLAKQAVYEARRSLTMFAEGRDLTCEEVRRTISDGDGRSLRARRVRAHLAGCDSCVAFAALI